MAAGVMPIDDVAFEKEVLQSELPVLVDFWAPWCGPCRMVGPIVEQLASEYDGKLKVMKLNTDENPNTARNFHISGIPTCLLFKGGKVIDQLVGAHPKSQFQDFLSRNSVA